MPLPPSFHSGQPRTAGPHLAAFPHDGKAKDNHNPAIGGCGCQWICSADLLPLWYCSRPMQSNRPVDDLVAGTIAVISHDGMDLVEQDRKRIERRVFRGHCERVWQKLSSDDRNMLRERAIQKSPEVRNYDWMLENACLQEVEGIIREAGRFPTG